MSLRTYHPRTRARLVAKYKMPPRVPERTHARAGWRTSDPEKKATLLIRPAPLRCDSLSIKERKENHMNHADAMPPCLRRGHLLVGARFPHAAALGKPPRCKPGSIWRGIVWGACQMSSLFHHLRVGRAHMASPPLQVVLTLSTFRSNLAGLLRSPMPASPWTCRISSSERHTSGQLSETRACPAEPGFSCRRERRRGVTWGRTISRHLRRWPLPVVKLRWRGGLAV